MFSSSAFLKAELDDTQARTDAGERYVPSVEEFRDDARARIKVKRRVLLRSAILVVILVSVGGFVAEGINATYPISWFWIRIIRAFSLMLIAWSIWSKLDDIQTNSGKTVLELTSKSLFKLSYSLGILIGSFALFLDGSANTC